MVVTHGTLNINTGEHKKTEAVWETKPCGHPLFSPDDRVHGICSSCASGWTHPHNHPAEGCSDPHTVVPTEAE